MTFSQKFLGCKEEYVMYDFAARKKRRGDSWINRDIAKENLILFKKILSSVNLDFILLYGTLLGAIRENDFIEHDYDTDVSIFDYEVDKLLDAKELLKENGFDLIRASASDNVLSFMRKDEYIDVYVFSLGTHFFKKYYQCDGGRIDFKYLDKLSKIEFLGEEFKIPNNAKKLLKKNYGSDWRIPIKGEEAMDLGVKNLYRHIKRKIRKLING